MNTQICLKIKIRKGQYRIEFFCDYCGNKSQQMESHFNRKGRHFCSTKCYALFRKEKLPLEEQHAYRGVRQAGKSKQIYHRNYCKNHPENIAHLKARRYARERNAKGSHTLREWQDLKMEHEGCCARCGEDKPLTKDHIQPLSMGGSDYIVNIQPLCRNCNSKKWKHIYENPELLESK